jgi:hypothetical protein
MAWPQPATPGARIAGVAVRLPAPPRFVDLGGGHQLGGAGLDAGFAGRARSGQA